MQPNLTFIVPGDAELLAIAQLAAASHLHLISNGKTSALSPIVPAGWHKVTAMAKSAPTPRPATRVEDWLAPGKNPKATQKESAIADVFLAPAMAGEPIVSIIKGD